MANDVIKPRLIEFLKELRDNLAQLLKDPKLRASAKRNLDADIHLLEKTNTDNPMEDYAIILDNKKGEREVYEYLFILFAHHPHLWNQNKVGIKSFMDDLTNSLNIKQTKSPH